MLMVDGVQYCSLQKGFLSCCVIDNQQQQRNNQVDHTTTTGGTDPTLLPITLYTSWSS